MAAEIETIRVKLFILFRSPENSLPLRANFSKHWGLLIQYYDENDAIDGEQFLEGVPNGSPGSQILEARNSPWTRRMQKQWESAPGYEKIALQENDNYHQIPADAFVGKFCAQRNRDRNQYNAMVNNCQNLVKDFLAEATIETSLVLESVDEAGVNFLKVSFVPLLFRVATRSDFH